jgi:hypothetical protein
LWLLNIQASNTPAHNALGCFCLKSDRSWVKIGAVDERAALVVDLDIRFLHDPVSSGQSFQTRVTLGIYLNTYGP